MIGMRFIFSFIAAMFLISCGVHTQSVNKEFNIASLEMAMPFYNLSYHGERLFPIFSNNAEKTFRVWFNNGTNIDRIFTVSKDSIQPPYGMGYESYICEILVNNQMIKQYEFTPRSGFESFFIKLDSLDLFNKQSQTGFYGNLAHRPISLYVIELKDKERYHQFNFKSDFPFGQADIDETTEYGTIEKFIISELFVQE